MNRLELIRTANRRLNRVDRRQCTDRRGHTATAIQGPGTIAALRELLDAAHARIRALERDVEALKKVI